MQCVNGLRLVRAEVFFAENAVAFVQVVADASRNVAVVKTERAVVGELSQQASEVGLLPVISDAWSVVVRKQCGERLWIEFWGAAVEVSLVFGVEFEAFFGEALCGYLIVGKPQLSPALADALIDAVVAGWRAPLEVRR